ncbi:hypothetical protein HN588_12605 [Candidatus Bathyarchaeota archaeon]|nr:hypothetical protein [Candidatus Bathyarchaeota archaeon]
MALAVFSTTTFAMWGPSVDPYVLESDVVSKLVPILKVPKSGSWSMEIDGEVVETVQFSVKSDGDSGNLTWGGEVMKVTRRDGPIPFVYRSVQHGFPRMDSMAIPTTGHNFMEFVTIDEDFIRGSQYLNTADRGIIERTFSMNLLEIDEES